MEHYHQFFSFLPISVLVYILKGGCLLGKPCSRGFTHDSPIYIHLGTPGAHVRFLMLLGCKLNQGSKLQCEGTIPRRKIVRGEKGKEMPSRGCEKWLFFRIQ